MENKTLPVIDQNTLRWNRLNLKRNELGIVEAFNAFRDAGVEPILIKGWAAARNYPEEKPRFFGDIDLAVSKEEYDLAERLLYEETFPKVGIDLHKELRHLDIVSWSMLFNRTELIEIDGTDIRILRPEDHFRVLCVHWLTDGGAYKERLWDIYYAVENRPKTFDWDLCLKSVSATRQKWIVTTIAIAHKYLDLDVTSLPFSVDAENIPRWMTKCLETEWSSEIRLRPLHTCLHEPRLLARQVLKRLPGNPIQATIDVEGEFDDGWRLPKQIGSMTRRIGPSAKRVYNTVTGRSWK